MRTKPAGRRPSPRQGEPSLPVEVLAVRPSEAWRMLGIAPSTGWKWVKDGRLSVVRVGPNCTMVPVAELRDFIARHTVPASPRNLPDAAD